MKFSEIIGQDAVKNYLVNTVKSSRVSHAQMFIGPQGSGKLALAIAYARFLMCSNKQYSGNASGLSGDACGTCPSCIKINKLSHPDLHFFYPVATTKDIKRNPKSADFIGLWRQLLLNEGFYISVNQWYETMGIENKQGIINAEDCDEIVRTVSMKPFEAEYKVVILWLPEKLFHAAAPKILKILEEPPGKTLFILISENPDQVINTIVSRTQMVKILKLKDKEIIDALINEKGSGDIAARKAATFAAGNYILAKEMLAEENDEDYNFETLRKWLRLCYRFSNEDVADLIKLIDQWAKIGREKQKAFFQYSLKIIRNTLLTNYKHEKMLRSGADETDFVSKFSGVLKPSMVSMLSEELNRAIFHIERNANPRILMMDLSFTIKGIMHL